jgi:hypothetical protein
MYACSLTTTLSRDGGLGRWDSGGDDCGHRMVVVLAGHDALRGGSGRHGLVGMCGRVGGEVYGAAQPRVDTTDSPMAC